MGIMIEQPPIVTGSPEQSISSIISWLYRLTEQLNVALQNLDAECLTTDTINAFTEVSAIDIQMLENKIEEIRTRLNTDLTALKTTVQGHTQSIASIQEEIGNIGTILDNLNGEVI